MNIDFFIIGVLTVLLLGQHVFWSRTVLQLTNRLMSRNYYDFKQAEQVGKPRPASPSVDPDQLVIDPIDQRQADEMNSIIGVI